MPKGSPFPKAGRFEIHSVPMFLLNSGDKTEVLVCKAEMVVQTREPYSNASKRRQVDVEVLSWVATGTSKLLGGGVEFRMTPQRPLKSWVKAGRDGDLPGEARFAMRYQVTTPQGTIKDLTGVATGTIQSFPPRGDVFKVDKTLSIGNLRVIPVACACPIDVSFSIPRELLV